MKISLPESKFDKRRRLNALPWHTWFAWRPVRDSVERRLLWLENVARKSSQHGINPVEWEYMTVADWTKMRMDIRKREEAPAPTGPDPALMRALEDAIRFHELQQTIAEANGGRS